MEQKLGISNGQMTLDGKFTLQGLECLAACDKAPMMYINEEQYNNLTPEQIDEVLDALP
jgi:NADH-quinone oxidoreductase subunit E